MQKKNILPAYLPYFSSDRYRKQTINFFRPDKVCTHCHCHYTRMLVPAKLTCQSCLTAHVMYMV